jgi:anaerobic selenocysteine-containing dehydrogenase
VWHVFAATLHNPTGKEWLMNVQRRLLLPLAAAAALVAPLAAQANSVWHPANTEAGVTQHPDHAGTPKSTAAVQAEIEAARKDGSLEMLRRGAPAPAKSSAAPKTRQQVIDEMNNESAESRRARQLALAGS